MITISLDAGNCDKVAWAAVKELLNRGVRNCSISCSKTELALMHGRRCRNNFRLPTSNLTNFDKAKAISSRKNLEMSSVKIWQDDGQHHTLPELDVAVITGSEHGGFKVTEWVEQQQRVVAGTCAVPVGNSVLLLSVDLADQDRHVENQLLSWLSNHSFNHHFDRRLLGSTVPLDIEPRASISSGFGADHVPKRGKSFGKSGIKGYPQQLVVFLDCG